MKAFSLTKRFLLWMATIFLAGAPGVRADEPKPGASEAPVSMEVPGMKNVFRVTGRFWSGSQPEGDAAFATLARLGVKTIISVDGAKPDVGAARKHGLRYIHLPIGYDGVDAQRSLQLAQAAATIQGPVFVHCHHGKHRGPAAVAVMCRETDGWTAEQAEAWLHQAGTGSEYPGLYRSAKEFQPPPKEQLAAAGPLPEITPGVPLVDAMVAIDERLDSLKKRQKAVWKGFEAEGDSAAPDEATVLWEHFRELARTDDTTGRPAEYRRLLSDAERAAKSLADALRTRVPERASRDDAMKLLSASCAACHKAYRNKP